MYSLHTKPGTRGCVLQQGKLVNPYDARYVIDWNKSDGGVDIDHVVALHNAWLRGAWDWKASKREQFANDPLNLLAVPSDVNEERGTKTSPIGGRPGTAARTPSGSSR